MRKENVVIVLLSFIKALLLSVVIPFSLSVIAILLNSDCSPPCWENLYYLSLAIGIAFFAFPIITIFLVVKKTRSNAGEAKDIKTNILVTSLIIFVMYVVFFGPMLLFGVAGKIDSYRRQSIRDQHTVTISEGTTKKCLDGYLITFEYDVEAGNESEHQLDTYLNTHELKHNFFAHSTWEGFEISVNNKVIDYDLQTSHANLYEPHIKASILLKKGVNKILIRTNPQIEQSVNVTNKISVSNKNPDGHRRSPDIVLAKASTEAIVSQEDLASCN